MLKYSTNHFIEDLSKKKYSGFYLGGDIGGTFTRFAVAGIKKNIPELIFNLNFETKSLESAIPAIKKTLDYADEKYQINIESVCTGSAGIVSNSKDFVKLTNAKWSIDAKEIMGETNLSNVFLINDFQAIGYGVNFLDLNNNKDVFKIRENIQTEFETKAVIGAGTGLGKCILNYHKNIDCYIPIASEGGNIDFPFYDDSEAELVKYIKELRNISKPIVYEELLSGRGIEGIYKFLSKNNNEKTRIDKEIENSNDKASLISRYKTEDETCKKTFELFSKFYARCAKNFALDTLSKGGIYIAGGIAAKNKEIFQSNIFIEEFNNGNRREDFLRNVPIYVILNPYTGLLGSCHAARIKSIQDE